MNQLLLSKTTNYLSPYQFYNKFLFWVPRLESFISKQNKLPMSANAFVLAYRIQYGSGLRVTELISLKKQDINLNHRLLLITKAKTGYNQRATILPYDISSLEKHLDSLSKEDIVFPTNRHILWEYAKDAGRLAGLNIAEIQKQKVIDGVWTHLMRKSCSKRMAELGASRELRMVKLRHAMKDAHDAYDLPDVNALLEWEDQQFNGVLN